MNKERFLLVDYSEREKNYQIFSDDFEKIEEYCQNECMGVKFLINANFLRELVKNLQVLNFLPPFTVDDFISEKSKESLKKNGVYKLMEKNFGTDDLKLVASLVIKQTYNFLHKV